MDSWHLLYQVSLGSRKNKTDQLTFSRWCRCYDFLSFQCYDTAGLATGTASSLYNLLQSSTDSFEDQAEAVVTPEKVSLTETEIAEDIQIMSIPLQSTAEPN